MQTKLIRLPGALRSRLLLLLLLPLSALLTISLVSNFHAASEPALLAFDHALGDDVVELATKVSYRDGHFVMELPAAAEYTMRTDLNDTEFMAIHDPEGKFIAGDPDLIPNKPDARHNPHFSNDQMRGLKVRKASYRLHTPDGEITATIAETMERRKHTTQQIFMAMLTSNLMLMGTSLLLVYFGVRIGLEPLNRLGAQIGCRPKGELSPLPETRVPSEAQPLVHAMNSLMADLQAASLAQQAFLADAAHQLRTPLAALQTQLELAAEEMPATQRQRILQLQDASTRLGHLAHQLLALARSGPEAMLAQPKQEVDLKALLEEQAGTFYDAALAHAIDLGFEPRSALVLGTPWLLQELLANLVDNAIRYTPAGGRITIRSGMDADKHPFLAVEDNGPGIPAAERERIFERFYRLPGSSNQGTGLGLAIVKAVADRHQAQVLLQTGADRQGIVFQVKFPIHSGPALAQEVPA